MNKTIPCDYNVDIASIAIFELCVWILFNSHHCICILVVCSHFDLWHIIFVYSIYRQKAAIIFNRLTFGISSFLFDDCFIWIFFAYISYISRMNSWHSIKWIWFSGYIWSDRKLDLFFFSLFDCWFFFLSI